MSIEKCRACGNTHLKEIIYLGDQYVSDFVKLGSEDGIRSPLKLILCNKEDGGCGLLQLADNAPNKSMWNSQYWYKSAINPTIRADLKDIVENVERMVPLKEGDIVIDIGCNDGTMMMFYQNEQIIKVGFDPSSNVAQEAKEKGIEVINNYFNKENFIERFGNKKVKVITAISMFYDLEDPNSFLEDINFCLEDDGLFIIQQNYLIKMLENNGLDNICHEHREYYSFMSLKSLLERHNFEVVDLVLNGINGGSIRTYIKKKGVISKLNEENRGKIERIEKYESDLRLETSKPYLEFAKRINEIKEKTIKFIEMENRNGKLICGSGASTKGNTTLQYFEMNPTLIRGIEDKNPEKYGRVTVGTRIPVVSPEEVEKLKPDYLFVLIWYFLEDVKRNQKDFLERGGKLIVPFPKVRIVSKEGEFFL